MINKILAALKKAGVSVYNIVDTVTESAEIYFIKKQEDMRRMKSIREITVTVYRDFEANDKKMRGMSDVQIAPGMTEEEIAKKISVAYESACYVMNPFFELADPVKDVVEAKSEIRDLPLEEAARIMADALFTPDTDEEAFINSAEIFVDLQRVHILSSLGSDISFTKERVWGEFVAQCVRPQDVEMYFDFNYDTLDTYALSKLSLDAITIVSDRAQAKSAPAAGEYDLILTEKHVNTVLSSYLEKADAAMIFAKYSPYEIGFNAQGESIQGEKLNLMCEPDQPYSMDGVKLIERTILKDGVVSDLVGATRFCRYMGIEPKGHFSKIRVENGTVSLDEMKKKPYLMPVAFSDFQMDAMSGRFGGEIRLAYLFDGESISLVTGGSVNGSLLEKQNQLVFSKETYRSSDYSGPLAVLIPSVSVAGA
ncbi:MAG: hypothetical protein IKJ65_00995 [Clostridia bacterium]|nr:hypothetical protein [Clostridia bacterium]